MLRSFVLLLFAWIASAATILMDLDAFRLVGPGNRFTLQIRMLDREGRPVTRFIRFTNIEAQNIRFVYEGEAIPLDRLPELSEVWASGLVEIQRNDEGLPASLRFQLEDAETGETISSDDFSIFLYEYLPASGSFNFRAVTPMNAVLPVADPIPPGPEDANNPGNPGEPGDLGDPGDPGDPGNPGNEIPEPSTYALVGVALLQAVIWRRYSFKRSI